MYAVVDTNVLVVANDQKPHPDSDQKPHPGSPQCVVNCVKRLKDIQTSEVLVLDDLRLIISEYSRNALVKGQGVGDRFLKWVLQNQADQRHCCCVTITPDNGSFKEFPTNPELEKFDLSDRKFVAVALTHPERPPIYNAVDSDWHIFQDALQAAGVHVEFLCPDQDASPLGSSRRGVNSPS